MPMFIQINLKDDVEEAEAVRIAREIIDVLDDADKISDQITEICIGGDPVIWISDEAADAADNAEKTEPLHPLLEHLNKHLRSREMRERAGFKALS